MIQFIQAGFAELLPQPIGEACQRISSGIRTAVACNDEHREVSRIVKDAYRWSSSSDASSGASAIIIVGGWDWRREDGSLYQQRQKNLLPMKDHLANQCDSIIAAWRECVGPTGNLSGLWIEIGNELDLSYWRRNLREYHELVMYCYDRVRSVSAAPIVVTGSVANFDRGEPAYDVLRKLCRMSWPDDTTQGLHPYRSTSRQDLWPSWPSEESALNALRVVLRGRPAAITEMGWYSSERFSDVEIAEFTRDEITMWRKFGARAYVAYQIQDAALPYAPEDSESRFGCCSNLADGLEPKPAYDVLTKTLAESVS